ncbi:MAG: hypothetical protein EA378_12070 [Phycisphaerales bacterium]|nr:MAG: hypothetical protein EA378_12070 [Phycisphaerales bacterium]
MNERELIRDIIHFTKINRAEAADVLMRELLSREISPEDFTRLIEDTGELVRFEEALALAVRTPELERSAARLARMYERGKLDRARDPEQIAENIAMLTGGARGRLLARQRLLEAGEYAMPQLLAALLQRANPSLQAEVQRLLIDKGQQAVTPLATALASLDPVRQELVLTVLGQIGSETVAPYIHDLLATTTNQEVASAGRRAITRLGTNDPARDVADWYLALANDYYNERRQLTSFPGEEQQLLWGYDGGLGLVMTPIRTEVYHEAMAMRLSERSLTLRGENAEALALWVASNYRRELQQPQGYTNPVYPASRRSAEYFAVASGTDVTQRVLARALDDRDTPLARRALAAIERTAGSAALRQGPRGRQPLLEALGYPNRRVQIESALALGSSQPRETFAGAERVIPTLADAVRDAETRYAVVLSSDQELYQGYRQIVERLGYQVLPFSPRLEALAEPLANVSGLDLVVTTLGEDSTEAAIEEVRSSARFSATPVLALMPTRDYTRLQRRYERQQGVMLRPIAIDEQLFANAATELVRVASGGPISAEEAQSYAERSLRVLRDLAIGSSPVLDVRDATQPLIAALGTRTGPIRQSVADVLALVDEQRAQSALMVAALEASGAERVMLLNRTTESVKRFGSMLSQRQITRLVEIARTGSPGEATAAAALMGALDLPNNNILPLILDN